MLKSRMNYSALAVKVRSMYGKRLKHEDYMKMASMQSMADIAVYLQQHPGWAEGLRGFHAAGTNRAFLIDRLHRIESENYAKLFYYMSKNDKEIMQFPVVEAEMEQVMAFMRLAAAERSNEYNCTLPPYYVRHSDINYRELSEAEDYAGLLSAVRGADFQNALARIAPADGSFPPYAQVEIIMQGYYYRKVFNLAQNSYRGRDRDLLIRSFGQQIDLINIIHTLRIKRSLSRQADMLFLYLLPIYYKLKPSFFKDLFAAEDVEEENEFLGGSSYGKLFTQNRFPHWEDYYYRLMHDFHRRQISMGKPSVLSAVSYLFLKKIEMRNVIRVIESVYYQFPPSQMASRLLFV